MSQQPTEPAPEPRVLSGELSSWALTQTGGTRALAGLVAEVAAQVEALAVRVAALEVPPAPEQPAPIQQPTVTAAAKTTTKRGTR